MEELIEELIKSLEDNSDVLVKVENILKYDKPDDESLNKIFKLVVTQDVLNKKVLQKAKTWRKK